MGKTIRFGDLVRSSGRPQFVTLWTAPEKDHRVSRAMKESRVLTVLEEPGQRPHGLLGLHPGPHSMFLVFPRRLELDPKARVVGVNYALAKHPEVRDPIVVPDRRHKTKPTQTARHKPLTEVKPKPAALPEPVKKTFTVRLRRVAVIEETRKVEAEDRVDAERQALKSAQAQRFDIGKAVVRGEIVSGAT